MAQIQLAQYSKPSVDPQEHDIPHFMSGYPIELD